MRVRPKSNLRSIGSGWISWSSDADKLYIYINNVQSEICLFGPCRALFELLGTGGINEVNVSADYLIDIKYFL